MCGFNHVLCVCAVVAFVAGGAPASAGHVHWAQLYEDRIMRAELNGDSPEFLWEWPQANDPVGIAVDPLGGKVYWAQKYHDQIIRVDLDGQGSEPEIILESPSQIEVVE